VNLQNIDEVFGRVFEWQPGDEIEVKLDRKGEEIIIKTTLTQSYTKGETLHAKENATNKQISLRKAWLKG